MKESFVILPEKSQKTEDYIINNKNIKQIIRLYNCVVKTIRNNINKNYGKISEWNVSNVTDMKELFKEHITFNEDISKWNVSNVTDMSHMFEGASQFNQPLNKWNVSNVTNMAVMFGGADSFNQPLDNWNVSSVTDMSEMFYRTLHFNQNIDKWNVSQVKNMNNMFYATRFNLPLNNWNVSNVKNMWSMFAESEFNQPLNNWDVSNVTTMEHMFAENVFNQPLNDWNVSNVTDMTQMFSCNNSFNQPLNNWNVSSVTTMYCMFYEAFSFNQPLNNWNISKVKNVECMFYKTKYINQPTKNWLIFKKKHILFVNRIRSFLSTTEMDHLQDFNLLSLSETELLLFIHNFISDNELKDRIQSDLFYDDDLIKLLKKKFDFNNIIIKSSNFKQIYANFKEKINYLYNCNKIKIDRSIIELSENFAKAELGNIDLKEYRAKQQIKMVLSNQSNQLIKKQHKTAAKAIEEAKKAEEKVKKAAEKTAKAIEEAKKAEEKVKKAAEKTAKTIEAAKKAAKAVEEAKKAVKEAAEKAAEKAAKKAAEDLLEEYSDIKEKTTKINNKRKKKKKNRNTKYIKNNNNFSKSIDKVSVEIADSNRITNNLDRNDLSIKVREILQHLNLEEQLGPIFLKHKINDNALPFLDVQNLFEIGINNNDAIKIITAISKYESDYGIKKTFDSNNNSDSKLHNYKLSDKLNNILCSLDIDEKIINIFIKEEIDDTDISSLTISDLEDIGISKDIGQKLLDAFNDSKKTKCDSVRNNNKIIDLFTNIVPEEFICPITLDLMKDPVMASDGNSYERSEIENWFKLGNKTSPKTNDILEYTLLIPNNNLKILINEYKERNNIKT